MARNSARSHVFSILVVAPGSSLNIFLKMNRIQLIAIVAQGVPGRLYNKIASGIEVYVEIYR